MSLRFQRLVIIFFSVVLVGSAIILILVNSKNKVVFFFTPSELINVDKNINQKVRIGGYVKEGSLIRKDTGDIYNFIITDNANDIEVSFDGILPALFKEKQGAVIEGILVKEKKIKATKVFAKHDENYMPASIKKELENKDYWKKNYKDSELNISLPEFKTVNLFNKSEELTNLDLKDKKVIINFFASWCAPCKKEHPLILSLKKNHNNIFIIGIDHKDIDSDAKEFLDKEGNPYHFVGIDDKGSIAFKFGVFGLPETFLINKNGKIIYKHSGPLTKKIINDKIVPYIQ
tara:strand:- start:32 stop:898 length:867 start_codon:yes stop_codon:yes gene_type:complete